MDLAYEGDVTIEPDDDAERDGDWPLDEHQPPPCPICGRPAVPIAYGMPSRELMDLAERGAVRLGGCVMRPNQPTRKCPAGHAFQARPPR
jgi:hypothetical protein